MGGFNVNNIKYLFIVFCTIFIINNSFSQPMSGNYMIGTGSFQTFNDAVNSLITNGVSGPTVFTVADGIYNESIQIPQINGASEINTITFIPKEQDSTTVTLISNEATTVLLDGADYIRFLHMGIKTGSHHVLEYTNEANNNIISNCIIEGDITTSNSTTSALVYSSGYNDTNNVFQNTHFIGGAYGFYYIGSTSREASTLIYNNVFDEQNYHSIHLGKQFNPVLKKYNITINIWNQVSVYQ